MAHALMAILRRRTGDARWSGACQLLKLMLITAPHCGYAATPMQETGDSQPDRLSGPSNITLNIARNCWGCAPNKVYDPHLFT
jgi:hypothetical protein